jgi:hypothetical protein
MASRSGFSCSTISTKSPSIGAASMTRSVRSPLLARMPKLSEMLRKAFICWKSKVAPTVGGMSLKASSRRAPLTRSAMVSAPTFFSSCLTRSSGKASSGTASSTRAAVRAEASLSPSQALRKLAMDGTKISTSATMTKSSVNSSSRLDRPKPRHPCLACPLSAMHHPKIRTKRSRRCSSGLLSFGSRKAVAARFDASE